MQEVFVFSGGGKVGGRGGQEEEYRTASRQIVCPAMVDTTARRDKMMGCKAVEPRGCRRFLSEKKESCVLSVFLSLYAFQYITYFVSIYN